MLTKGYKVFQDLPTFLNIGGSSAVPGWNSPNCGSPRFTKLDFVTDARGSLHSNRYLLDCHLQWRDDHRDGD